MFDMLIESKKQTNKRRELGGGAVSMAVHAVLIVGVIFATFNAKEQLAELLQDTTLVFVTPPEPDEPPPLPPEQLLATMLPPPKGFQTLFAIEEIPTEIPEIDLTQHFDPRDFTGKGAEGGTSWGVEDGTPIDLNATFLEAVVEERPDRLTCPTPRYPRLLKQAQIEGNVLLRFIIDTVGRAEPASIEVVQSDNPGFNSSALAAIRSCRYRAGRVRGRPVRVIVQQAVRFRLAR